MNLKNESHVNMHGFCLWAVDVVQLSNARRLQQQLGHTAKRAQWRKKRRFIKMFYHNVQTDHSASLYISCNCT